MVSKGSLCRQEVPAIVRTFIASIAVDLRLLERQDLMRL